MCDQCSEFGKEIENLMTDREKSSFTEEMYRKLRQVTKRWTSWHHKSFGNVTSKQYVFATNNFCNGFLSQMSTTINVKCQ